MLRQITHSFFLFILCFPLQGQLQLFLFITFAAIIIRDPVGCHTVCPCAEARLFLIKRINPLQNSDKNFLCQIKRKFPLSGLPVSKCIDFPVVSPDQFIRCFFILFFLNSAD